MREIVYVGIGSNIEPRIDRIESALKEVKDIGTILTVSSIYESEPYGFSEQSAFLNAVVALVTDLDPFECYRRLKELEVKLGRKKRQRWHEREIDLDILFFGDKVVSSDMLTIPHADLINRSFVLLPLVEIAPNIVHPVLEKTVKELSEAVGSDTLRIARPRP